MFVPRTLNKNKMGLNMNELVTTRHVRYNTVFTTLSFTGNAQFRLSYLPNHTEYVALFDCYKIWKVEVTFIPRYNSAEFGALTMIPTIYVASDRTDSVAPSTVNEVCEYATCVAHRMDRPFMYTIWPSLATDDNLKVIDERQKDLWCASAHPDVQHNGIKYAVDLPIGLASFPVDIVHKYFLKFKDCK